jgi:hypothetical protein
MHQQHKEVILRRYGGEFVAVASLAAGGKAELVMPDCVSPVHCSV